MARIIDDEAGIEAAVKRIKRVAVLGIKTEAQAGQPACDVAAYLAGAGLEVIPLPVYYPEVTTILGKPVVRKIAELPGELDCVDVFRRPQDIDGHVADLIAKKPK